jgi:hypothetical protein
MSKTQDDGSTVDIEIVSVTAEYVKAARLKLEQGSLPNDTDFAEERKVIVLSQKALEQLGLDESVLGGSVEFANFFDGSPTTYTVIGILKKPANDFDWMENSSLIPYSPPP